MPKQKTVKWHEIDKTISGLETDIDHEILVQREAIPLVFVPGIMGTNLRRTPVNRLPADTRLPEMRWDLNSLLWAWNFSRRDAAGRRAMLVGDAFSSDYLEPNDSNPVGDGIASLFDGYYKFVKGLKTQDWGALSRVFEFPVFAFGYNWTDSVQSSGKKLADRIKEIIEEADRVVGYCQKVILVTHSMGGLVARSASELAGAKGSIIGIVHGVQPTTGATAGYWRIKGGFESAGGKINDFKSTVLGHTGDRVTPILGNIPGGLQLLPNKLHRTNHGKRRWLTVTRDGQRILSLPKSDPYKEIYRVKAVVRPPDAGKPSRNRYWGLVDPSLLTPGELPAGADPWDHVANGMTDAWKRYIRLLKVAERFHDKLKKRRHRHTFNVRGVGQRTANVIELLIQPTDPTQTHHESYPTRGFRGFLTGSDGELLQAVLQDPRGDGDATVPRFSGGALDKEGKPMPGDLAVATEHQPAYDAQGVRDFAFKGIVALCKQHFETRRGGA